MITELLKLGLTQEEAKVYLACLEIGGGPVSVIARKAGSERVSCYHTLENLLEKRLLNQHTKNNIKYFSPEPPEQLLRSMQEKTNIATGLIPQLKSLMSSFAFKPKIRFYEGREGVERVFEESLTIATKKELAGDFNHRKRGSESMRNSFPSMARVEILGYTNLKSVIDFIPIFFEEYTHEKLRLGIKTRYLSPTTVESVHVMDPFLPKGFDPNLIEILLVNKDQFPFENEILIFGNSVGIVSLNRDELLGLIVESPTLAKTMKAVFDLAWLGATAFVAK